MTDNALVPLADDNTLDTDTLPFLSEREAAWFAHYVTDARFNARLASRLAGFSDTREDNLDLAGWRMKRNERVRAHIRAFMVEKGLTPEEALATVAELATSSIEDAVDVDEDGHWRLNLDKARERGRLHTIKKLRDSPKFGVEIEMHDPYPALHDILTIHKLFPERTAAPQVQVNTQFNVNTQAALSFEEKIAKLEALAARLGYRLVKDDSLLAGNDVIEGQRTEQEGE